MRRSIPWFDFILYGSLALLATVAFLYLILFKNISTEQFIVMLVTVVGFITIPTILFINWLRSEPDYTDEKFGVSFWFNNIKELNTNLSKRYLHTMLKFFVNETPNLISKLMPDDAVEQSITSVSLSEMLYMSKVEWTRSKIDLIGIGWSVKDKTGLQKGKNIIIHWTGNLIYSALFHELFHMVDELVLHRAVDYDHKNRQWWDLVAKLKYKIVQRVNNYKVL